MNLLKILVLLCLSIAFNNSQAQTHTFIGEIDLGMGYFEGSDKTSYDIFFKNYFVKVYKANGTQRGKEIVNVRLLPKEDWYPQFNGETRKVELIIEIPDSLLSKSKIVEDIGSINIFWELWSRKSKIPKADNKGKGKGPLFVAWNKKDSTNITYINKTTFKLYNPIVIASPAEVGLKLSLEYLKVALDSTADDIPQLKYTVVELEGLLKKSRDSIDLSYFQFNNFSKFLIFLEPYVSEGSYINQEARELYQDVQKLKDSLNTLRKSEKSNTYIMDSISQEINSGLEIYSDYEKTITRIRKYHNKLQIILYGKQFNNLQRTFGTSMSTRNDYRKLHFAIGSSLLFDLNPLYNVTLARGDTVQFESISRLNSVLSAGLFWSPQLTTKLNKNEDLNSDSIKYQNFFSLGLLITYTLIPNSSQLPRSNPLGIGIATGFKTQNLGIYLTVNFRLVRQPRQYFIDQYKDANLTLGSLDINDNGIFVNRTRLALGFSVMYFINGKK